MGAEVDLRWEAGGLEEAFDFIDGGRGQRAGDAQAGGAVELVCVVCCGGEDESASEGRGLVVRGWVENVECFDLVDEVEGIGGFELLDERRDLVPCAACFCGHLVGGGLMVA